MEKCETVSHFDQRGRISILRKGVEGKPQLNANERRFFGERKNRGEYPNLLNFLIYFCVLRFASSGK
jgi:hypothetical protein